MTMAENDSDLSPAARAVFIVVSSSEIACGVVGNILLLLFLATRYSLHTNSVHNLFIANLALTDLFTLGYWMVFFLLDLSLGSNPVVNDSHCVVNGFVVATSTAVSVLSLISISLNRYLHVCHARFYLKVCSIRRTLLMCISCWVVGVLFSLPPLVGVGSYCYTSKAHICSFCRDGDHTYPKVVIGMFSIVPACIIGYCNFSIFRFWKNAYSSKKKTPQFEKNARRKDRRQQASWLKAQTERQSTFDPANYADVPMDRLVQTRGVSVEEVSQDGLCLQAEDAELSNTESRRRQDVSDDANEDDVHTQFSRNCSHTMEGFEPTIVSDCSSGNRSDVEKEEAGVQKMCVSIDVKTRKEVGSRETERPEADQAQSSLVRKEGENDIKDEPTDILAEGCMEASGQVSSNNGLHPKRQLPLKPKLADGQKPKLADGQKPKLADCQKPNLAEGQKPKLADCQKPKLADCQKPKLADCQKPNLAEGQKPKLADCQKPKLADGQKPKLADCQKPNLSEGQKPKLADCQKPKIAEGQKPKLTDGQKPKRRTEFKKNRNTFLNHVKRKKEKRRAKERAFVRSLFVVFLLFLCSFLSFAFVHAVDSELNLPAEVVISADLLMFFSSAANWIVYGVMNPSFRRGYRKLLNSMRGLMCQAADAQDQTYLSGSMSSMTTNSTHTTRTPL